MIYEVRKFDAVPQFSEPDPATGTYMLETNDAKMAKSCLLGSRQPMAVYVGRKFITSNFALLELAAMKKALPYQGLPKKKVAPRAPRRRQGGFQR